VEPSRTAEGIMLQESSTWDLRYISREPSNSMKYYVVFLFAVCILAGVKLVRVWRAAPPFRLSRNAGSAAFLHSLETSSTSLRQWMGLTLLAWGIFASVSLYDGCNRILDPKSTGSFLILFVIQDFSTTLTMALLVALFLYLVRWHMLKRIERLRHIPG
jgi:hypothetical protein